MDWKTLLGLGAQVSGYQNPEWAIWLLWLAAASGLVSSAIAIYKGIRWIKTNVSRPETIVSVIIAGARRNLIPILIGAVGIAGAILLAVAVTSVIAYRGGYFDPPPSQVVVVPPPSQPQTTAANQPPQALIVPISPTIPKETADQVARYLVLVDLDRKADAAKQRLTNSVAAMLKSMRPQKQDEPVTSPRSRIQARDNYDIPLGMLRAYNKDFYVNRPLDFESAPDMSNPLKTAPYEEEFGDDKDGQYRYRAFYFQTVNVVRQSEKLVSDIKDELQAYKSRISNTPYAKLLEQ